MKQWYALYVSIFLSIAVQCYIQYGANTGPHYNPTRLHNQPVTGIVYTWLQRKHWLIYQNVLKLHHPIPKHTWKIVAGYGMFPARKSVEHHCVIYQ